MTEEFNWITQEPDAGLGQITCEAQWNISPTVYRFLLQAIGHEGIYIAAASMPFRCVTDPANRGSKSEAELRAMDDAFTSFRKEITQEGWEPISGHGRHWYSYRYRHTSQYHGEDASQSLYTI